MTGQGVAPSGAGSGRPDVGADLRGALGAVGLWTVALDQLPAPLVREHVQELEELGYPALWLSEGLRRDIFVNASIMLEATRRLVVASGIANIWARDAAAMVASQLTLAEASEGRFLLGMGVSRPKIVEEMRGHTYASPLARMTAYIDAMEAVAYQSPRPAHEPPHVLAAIGPKMLELSGKRSAGAHTYFVVPEHTAESRAALGPGPVLCPEQAVVLEPDPGKARAIAREHAQFYLQFGSYRKALEKRGFVDADFEDGGSDRVIDAVVGWGDVDAIQARVQEHLDAGADHVAVQVLTAQDAHSPLEAWRELAPALLSCTVASRS